MTAETETIESVRAQIVACEQQLAALREKLRALAAEAITKPPAKRGSGRRMLRPLSSASPLLRARAAVCWRRSTAIQYRAARGPAKAANPRGCTSILSAADRWTSLPWRDTIRLLLASNIHLDSRLSPYRTPPPRAGFFYAGCQPSCSSTPASASGCSTGSG